MENGLFYAKMGFGKEEAPPSRILPTQAENSHHAQAQRLTTSSNRPTAVSRKQKNKKCHIVTLLQLGVVIGAPSSSSPLQLPQKGESSNLLETPFIMHY
jgi:hypothetical protein